MEKNGSEKQLLEKIGELAFCRSNDAVKLAFLREDAAELIDGMDLSALTELHRLSNGTVELKFIDRIKLLELLERAGARSAEAGTAAVRVLPRSRGIGTVDIVFSTTDGVPTAAERAQVQALLDAEREICVDIRVLAPTTAELDVTAELTAAQDRDFAEVSAAAEAVLRTFFTGALLGRPVYRAKLESLLMAVDGVENCRLTAPAADLPGERVTLPVLGTVTISEAV